MRYVITLVLLFSLTSCTRVNVYPTGQTDAGGATSAASAAEKKDDKKDPFKPWDDVLKDTRPIDGLIKMHLKRDRTLYLELTQAQLGKDYGMVLHFSRGLGDFSTFDGLNLTDTRIVRFERIGDKIHLVHRNLRFTADAGSPMASSLSDNVGHSIIEVAKIESQNKDSKNLLIDVTNFFVSDYADLGDMLKFFYAQKPVSFDKESSYVESAMGFPENLEIDAALTFKASGTPIMSPDAVSDYRSLPIGVRYSIFKLPEDPMKPRLADDRVGHFIDTIKDFSRDDEFDPYIHYVNRWRLEKKDPTAAISEPVKQIVYYIDRSVPREYRSFVKDGIEAWNKAFEGAGFKNAIVAVEAPENDSTWSAEDIRYSTVRWSAAHRMGFAIGPSQTDPRTGEILNADVLVSAEFVRGWMNDYVQLGPTTLMERYHMLSGMTEQVPENLRGRMCVAEWGMMQQLGFMHASLAALGEIASDQPVPGEYIGPALRWLVMHEVGHTLGLRHNFKSSSGVPYEKLNDREFTGKYGLMLSVMDYPPVNFSADRTHQGHYFSPVVGSYDDWAIKYSYLPVPLPSGTNGHSAFNPEDELTQLAAIAREAADPMHTYNTDEDNWLGAWAVDPLSNAWELGSDPLQFARDRSRLVDLVTPELETRLITDGESYQRLRGARVSVFAEEIFSLVPVVKTVGGLAFVRDHKGDPGGRQPFTPVPAARQREAVQLIIDEIFAPDAFSFDPATLNRLAPNRMWTWSIGSDYPVDFPAHEYVSTAYEIFIDDLMHPARLQRMIENELRTDDSYRVSEMLATLSDAVWSEVYAGQNVNSFRRNLQRIYTDQLIRLMNDSPSWWLYTSNGRSKYSTSEHVRSLSRLELTDIKAGIDSALQKGTLDRDTRAHLLESQARIDRAINLLLSKDIE